MGTMEAILKVVRFKKDHIADGELWHRQGELALMLNQDIVPTCGNVGWCMLPNTTTNWNGITLDGKFFYHFDYIEDTDINPRTHSEFDGIQEWLSHAVVERYSRLCNQALELNREIGLLKPIHDILECEREQRDADACFEAVYGNNGDLNES